MASRWITVVLASRERAGGSFQLCFMVEMLDCCYCGVRNADAALWMYLLELCSNADLVEVVLLSSGGFVQLLIAGQKCVRCYPAISFICPSVIIWNLNYNSWSQSSSGSFPHSLKRFLSSNAHLFLICFILHLHYTAKSIGTPSNERFEYFSTNLNVEAYNDILGNLIV